MTLTELGLLATHRRSVYVRGLRKRDPAQWMVLVEEALLASRAMDAEGLACLHLAAAILGVTDEWFRWASRQDKLGERFGHLSWRRNGRPRTVPVKADPPPAAAPWRPDGETFRHHTDLHLRLPVLLDAMRGDALETVVIGVRPYLRFPEYARGEGTPVIVAPWASGLFVVNGWNELFARAAAGAPTVTALRASDRAVHLALVT